MPNFPAIFFAILNKISGRCIFPRFFL